ncbi:hypothetical protein Hanom_Chr04g00337151 [Helianthus anomalus]
MAARRVAGQNLPSTILATPTPSVIGECFKLITTNKKPMKKILEVTTCNQAPSPQLATEIKTRYVIIGAVSRRTERIKGATTYLCSSAPSE